jgi:hypothetical protein
MESLLFRKKVAAIASIVVTTGALLTLANPPSAFASSVSPSIDRCPAGSDYISLNGVQIRSKVVHITNPAPRLQHGEVVCGEHVYRLERTKSGSTWQEWHSY